MTAIDPVRASEFAPRVSSAACPDGPVAGARRPLNTRLGAEAGNDVALGHEHRPVWRGGVHSIGLILAVPAVVVLLLCSREDARSRVGVAVYAVGLCSMLTASVTYHRWVHGLRARCAWRRADHAAIFAAIGGSSTPIVLTALPGVTGIVLVGGVWWSAFVGAFCKLARWDGGDRAGTVFYAVTITLGAAAVPWLWVRHGIGPAVFVMAGGVVYLIGAACFAKNWPRLRPAVFGYHEVWHVFTVVAAVAQFAAIWMLAT